jgi:hypothetical protein
MPNTILNVSEQGKIISGLMGEMFEDKIQFVKAIDKEPERTFGSYNGFKAGVTANIGLPTRFNATSTPDITSTMSDVDELSVPLTVNNRSIVSFNLTSFEIATERDLKDWAKTFLEPAVSRLAQDVESRAMVLAKNAVYNSVGTAGATVFDTDTILAAGQKIDEYACPDMDNRFVLLNPAANRSAVNARKGLFQSSTAIAEQYRNGYMGEADGFTFLRNNLLPIQTNGNDVTGVAVASAVLTPATGATQLGVNGLTNTTGTVTAGQVFTIAGVNQVHPITKADLGVLQQFVVTANATASGTGTATLSISPTIYSSASGSLQNVSALPANTAALVFVGAESSALSQNLAFHKSAFRFASLPMVKPEGLDMVASKSVDGINIRLLRGFDIKTDQMIMRLDCLWGLAAVRPEWAVRLTA